MGILLYIIAIILWVIITPVNWLIVAIKYGLSNKYFFETAIDLDKFGNRNFRTFLNVTMKVKGGYEFGNVNETISSALGKNQRDDTLSWFGKIICKILDTIDKNHCKKSIKYIYKMTHFITVNQEATEEQSRAIEQAIEILEQAGLELVGTRPKDR